MQSKISCFNKTIYKKNLTRFWPFAVLYALYLIIAHPMVLYLELTSDYMRYGDWSAWQIVGSHFVGMTEPVSVFLVSIVIAIAVFGYLYQSRSANMIHAFPVTRTELFVTNYLSGLTLMVLPQILAALAANLVILGKANSMIWSVWAWFGITAGETVFFYGFACLIVMFTGQLLTAGLFYMIWNFLYIAVIALINAVGALLVYGLNGYLIRAVRHPLFPVAYLLGRVGFYTESSTETYHVQGILALLLYVGVGLIFAVLAWYLYQKRRIECAGDFLSMRWTAPVFRWGTALVGGAACALFCTFLTGESVSQNRMTVRFVVFLIIFAIALFFVAEMFIEKSFRVFKRKIAVEGVSCVAVLLVGVALLQFDVFGIESYVPQTDEILTASLWGSGSVSFEDAADVDRVRALHELILEHRKEQKSQSQAANGYMSTVQMLQNVEDAKDLANADHIQYYEYLNLSYTLKNGQKVSRAYQIMTYDVAFCETLRTQCKELFNDTEAIKRSCFGINYEEVNWQPDSASLECAKPDEQGDYVYGSYPVYGSKEQLQKLYGAVMADFDAGAFAEYGWDGATKVSATLGLVLTTDHKREDIRFAGSGGGLTYYYDVQELANGTQMCVSLNLNDRCTNTINALIELGVIESADDLNPNVRK